VAAIPGGRVVAKDKGRYQQIIEKIFSAHYRRGDSEVSFKREEIIATAKRLKIELPKNLGDLIYSFRHRVELPKSITKYAPAGKEWVIRSEGTSRYKFSLTGVSRIVPANLLAETKIPDATPGIITAYAMSDEQALLAKLRYNRLIDVFTGVACYSLQSHLRTQIKGMGQAETDELYVGIDKRGAHYVFPVQAKGGKDKMGVIQIEQDIEVCAHKFPTLICRPIAAQFMADGVIAMFALEKGSKGIVVTAEKHYRLVPPEKVTKKDLEDYRRRLLD
jgi:hypothetical protein